MTTQPQVGAQRAERVPLLHTKLHIPALPRDARRVPRPRLIERLNAGLHRKLTLISAPADFGKTTLVSEWVSHFRLGIADSGLETASASTLRNRQSTKGKAARSGSRHSGHHGYLSGRCAGDHPARTPGACIFARAGRGSGDARLELSVPNQPLRPILWCSKPPINPMTNTFG